MKNVRVFTTAFVLLCSCLVFTRCTPDTTGLTPSTEDVLIRNAWSVDYYYHNQDLTNNFQSANILCSSAGAVGYIKDGVTVAGRWSKSVDASNNELITLQFSTGDPNIEQLNKSWKLTDRTTSALQFVETDGTTNILLRIKTQ